MSADHINLSMTKAEALVLFDWLCKLGASTSAPPDNSAEEKVLWRLEALLERTLLEPLDPNYPQLLEGARQTVLSTD